ncbi:Ubiquitin carboxyl-terminal hydrolase 14 [Chamberlinius hualienensis]
MPNFKVKVKWGKETFDNVEVNTDEAPMLFKAQLFALTGVLPERQKVMLKGATLKNDDWGNTALKDGLMILMMGSKEEDVPKEPVQKTVFVEDLSENQLASKLKLPAGLNNLGNTCYMNATVQCLRSVPELRDALKRYTGSYSMTALPTETVVSGLRDLYNTMDVTSNSVPPMVLLQCLHLAVPRFAEKSEHGIYMQQDANECWSEVVRMLQQKLSRLGNGSSDTTQVSKEFSSFIDQYFGGDLDVTLKCNESEDEPVSNLKEKFLQLSCFISQEVKYMHSGLKSRMQEVITKLSPTLERDAQYTKTSKLSRLPAYLSIQFVRFYYKEKESVNAKILKEVKFPMSLDVFDLCSPELQQKLIPMRTRFKVLEDRALEMQQVTKDRRQKLDDVPKKKTIQRPFSFEDDIGSNNSGYYELQAVLTHKGRSSSSGHYVAWVKHKTEGWLQCDDEHVTPVTQEDILKLCGGGDWHCAYVLLYGPRILEEEEEETNKSEPMEESK